MKTLIILLTLLLAVSIQAQPTKPNRYTTNVDSSLINGGNMTNLQAGNITGVIPSANIPTDNSKLTANGGTGTNLIFTVTNTFTGVLIITNPTDGTYRVLNSTNQNTRYYSNNVIVAEDYFSNGVHFAFSSNNVPAYKTDQNGNTTYFQGFTNASANAQFGSSFTMVAGIPTFGQNTIFGNRQIQWGNAVLDNNGGVGKRLNLFNNSGNFTSSEFWVASLVGTNGITTLNNKIPASVTVGASPFTFTNPNPSALNCFITGSVAYSVAVNGVTVYGSLVGNDYLVLQTNSSLTITYTVAPTMATNSW